MTCKWPECDGNHDRCAVMLACRAQVPGELRGREDFSRQARMHDWMYQFAYANSEDWARWVDAGWDIDFVWEALAQQVADRLVAWVRWPGLAVPCRSCQKCMSAVSELDKSERCSSPRGYQHPLDSTPAGMLRGSIPECFVCRDHGGHFVPMRQPFVVPGELIDDTPQTEIPCPNIDWSALAEVVKWMSVSTPLREFASGLGGDLDEELLLVASDHARAAGEPVDSWADDPGLWPALHGWREKPKKTFAEVMESIAPLLHAQQAKPRPARGRFSGWLDDSAGAALIQELADSIE